MIATHRQILTVGTRFSYCRNQLLTCLIVQWNDEESYPESNDENLPDRGPWPLSEIEIEKVLMTAFPSGPIGLRESSSVVESSAVSLTHHHLWEFTNLKAKPGQVADNHIDPRANTSSDVHISATAI